MEHISAGDTAWVLVSAALVMVMTPALGFFYGGLVRRKNVLSTLMHSFFILCLISVQWVLWGYTLAFGRDRYGLIGDFSWIGLQHVGVAPSSYAPTIPHAAFALYQMMFAVITPALITGGFAERKRFKAFVVFSLLWATFVYDPIAHWVWGHGGWLANLGALDFAGGTVVHVSSGVAALVAAWMLGPRLRAVNDKHEPHDLTMVLLGAALCWFGWFGFNAGSALAANGIAAIAFINTNVAAATGGLMWIMLAWQHRGTPRISGAIAGAMCGLVAITPAAGYVVPSEAIAIGAIASVICYCAVLLRERLHIDDALDVFPIHGVGGAAGALLTGVFAVNGLLHGHPGQMLSQLAAVSGVALYTGVATYGILRIVMGFMPLRVSEHEELTGLDVSQHAEVAYSA
jgi:ammonium transporter, Amt family